MKRMSQALEGSTTRSLTPTPTPKSLLRVTSNAAPDEVPVIALRGDVENTGRADLVGRVLVPIEHTNSAPLVHLYHQGHGEMLDHMLHTRNRSPTTAA